MAIEHMVVYYTNGEREEFQVGEWNTNWIAVDSNTITISRDSGEEIIILANVRSYVIFKKGY